MHPDESVTSRSSIPNQRLPISRQADHSLRHQQLCGLFGLISLCVAVVNARIFCKLTPVYTAAECGDQEAVLKELSVGISVIHLGLEISVACTNPNPYQISILSSTPGRVFVAPAGVEVQVGHLEVIPGSNLAEEGTGTVRVAMNADIAGPIADKLLPHFLEDAGVPILMELQFNVGVFISFGLGSWETIAPFKKACGLKMQGILVNRFVSAQDTQHKGRLGPLVCRETFDGIQIPDVGEVAETPKDGRMGFSAAQVAPTEVEEGELVKNICLGTVISLNLLVGFALLYTAWTGESIAPSITTRFSSLLSLATARPTLLNLDALPVQMQSSSTASVTQPLVSKDAKDFVSDNEEAGYIDSFPKDNRTLSCSDAIPSQAAETASGQSQTRTFSSSSGSPALLSHKEDYEQSRQAGPAYVLSRSKSFPGKRRRRSGRSLTPFDPDGAEAASNASHGSGEARSPSPGASRQASPDEQAGSPPTRRPSLRSSQAYSPPEAVASEITEAHIASTA